MRRSNTFGRILAMNLDLSTLRDASKVASRIAKSSRYLKRTGSTHIVFFPEIHIPIVVEPFKDGGKRVHVPVHLPIPLQQFLRGHLSGREDHMLRVIPAPVLVQNPPLCCETLEQLRPRKRSENVDDRRQQVALLDEIDQLVKYGGRIPIVAQNERGLNE